MECPRLSELPPPPDGKTGWPWTVETPPLPVTRPDGSPWPRISIVTPSYNQGQFIEETIRSVLLQGYPDLEYILMDGGSTDSSVEIIRKYERWLGYWVSEKDRGQAHAINKGFEHVSGEIFNWINSDDALFPNALGSVASLSTPDHLVAAAVLNVSENSSSVLSNRDLTVANLIGGKRAIFHQPGLWLRTDTLRQIGRLDETLQYAFDYQIITKYLSRHPSVRYTNELVVKFRLHEQSKTMSMQHLFHEERMLSFKLIMAEPQYRDLHHHCEDRLLWDTWAKQIRILTSSGSKWKAALWLVAGIAMQPRIRLTRFTLGAIRNLIFS